MKETDTKALFENFEGKEMKCFEGCKIWGKREKSFKKFKRVGFFFRMIN